MMFWSTSLVWQKKNIFHHRWRVIPARWSEDDSTIWHKMKNSILFSKIWFLIKIAVFTGHHSYDLSLNRTVLISPTTYIWYKCLHWQGFISANQLPMSFHLCERYFRLKRKFLRIWFHRLSDASWYRMTLVIILYIWYGQIN